MKKASEDFLRHYKRKLVVSLCPVAPKSRVREKCSPARFLEARTLLAPKHKRNLIQLLHCDLLQEHEALHRELHEQNKRQTLRIKELVDAGDAKDNRILDLEGKLKQKEGKSLKLRYDIPGHDTGMVFHPCIACRGCSEEGVRYAEVQLRGTHDEGLRAPAKVTSVNVGLDSAYAWGLTEYEVLRIVPEKFFSDTILGG